jgi:hypothetical protein
MPTPPSVALALFLVFGLPAANEPNTGGETHERQENHAGVAGE